MVKMYPSVLKNKTTLFIVLLALSAPLFNLKVVGSVTIFDIFTLLAILVFFSSLMNFKTTLLLCFFILTFLGSEWNSLITMTHNGEKILDSLNILFRYLILLFVMPYLSYRLFYSDSKVEIKIRLFYDVLMCSFFGVLIFNIYAIYFQLEDYFFLQRFCSIYGNANTAALVLNIMSVLYLFNTTHPSVFLRILSYASIPLTITALIVTGSFSGYLIQAMILSVFLIKTVNVKVITFVVLVGIALFSIDLSNVDDDSQVMRGLGRFTGLVTIISSSDDIEISQISSIDHRMGSIKMALTELMLNPSYIFSGVGFGNVETLVENRTGQRTSIHLTYLQLMLSIGVFGTIMYLYVFLRVFRKIRLHLMGNNLIIQSAVLLLVFLFMGMFIPHTYMSFYFAPILPLLGLYGVKRSYG